MITQINVSAYPYKIFLLKYNRHPEKSTNHRCLALCIFHEMSLSMCTDKELKEPQNINTSAPIFLQSWPSPTILTSNIYQKLLLWDFLGDPVVKTPRFHYGGSGFDSWFGKFEYCQKRKYNLFKKKKRKKEMAFVCFRTSYEWNHTGFFFGVWLYSIGIIITRYPLLSSICVFCVY